MSLREQFKELVENEKDDWVIILPSMERVIYIKEKTEDEAKQIANQWITDLGLGEAMVVAYCRLESPEMFIGLT